MTTVHSRRRDRCQRGASFVELVVTIGLLCLVVGAVMLLLRDTIFTEFGDGARGVQSTSLRGR